MQLLICMQRTLNPANILVPNSHYSSLQRVDLKVAYEKTLIVCKLEDLREARSQNSRTKVLNRRSQPFMALEITIEGEML